MTITRRLILGGLDLALRLLGSQSMPASDDMADQDAGPDGGYDYQAGLADVYRRALAAWGVTAAPSDPDVIIVGSLVPGEDLVFDPDLHLPLAGPPFSLQDCRQSLGAMSEAVAAEALDRALVGRGSEPFAAGDLRPVLKETGRSCYWLVMMLYSWVAAGVLEYDPTVGRYRRGASAMLSPALIAALPDLEAICVRLDEARSQDLGAGRRPRRSWRVAGIVLVAAAAVLWLLRRGRR